MSSNSKPSKFAQLCLVIFLLFFLSSWFTIPSDNVASEFQICSLSFVNGIFVGWADDIAVWLYYSDSEATKQAALSAFKNAILRGEQYYPIQTMVSMLFGMFFSIGGIIALWMARSASDAGQAFRIGFFAEIIETIVFAVGYYVTTGVNPTMTSSEVVVTIGFSVIMGLIAMWVHKKYRR